MSAVTFSQRLMKRPGKTSLKLTLTNKNTDETLEQSCKQDSSKTQSSSSLQFFIKFNLIVLH